MLAGLAHHGPMRLRDMTNLAGGHEPQPTQLQHFVASGLVVRFGTERTTMMALNPAFPAVEELVALIRDVEPEPPHPRLPLLRDFVVPSPVVNPEEHRELFGPWRQTAILLTIANAGGAMTTTTLNGAMKSIRSRVLETRKTLKALVERRLVVVEGEMVRLHPKFAAAKALVRFSKAFCKAMSAYALRPAPSEPKPPATRLPPEAGQRRSYFNPAPVGPPPIVGRPPRYRVLAVLAVHGTVGMTDALKAANVGNPVAQKLIADGFVATVVNARTNVSRRAIAIAPGLVGRDEFIALLRRVEQRWPVPRTTALSGLAASNRTKVGILGQAYFGSPSRSEVLLTIAAIGTADLAMLRRAIPNHDIQEISRAVRTWEAYGIVRQVPFEGRPQGGFELNPDWFAATEMRSLLDALLSAEPRYAGRAAGAEGVMPAQRRKRKENAARRTRRLDGRA